MVSDSCCCWSYGYGSCVVVVRVRLGRDAWTPSTVVPFGPGPGKTWGEERGIQKDGPTRNRGGEVEIMGDSCCGHLQLIFFSVCFGTVKGYGYKRSRTGSSHNRRPAFACRACQRCWMADATTCLRIIANMTAMIVHRHQMRRDDRGWTQGLCRHRLSLTRSPDLGAHPVRLDGWEASSGRSLIGRLSSRDQAAIGADLSAEIWLVGIGSSQMPIFF